MARLRPLLVSLLLLLAGCGDLLLGPDPAATPTAVFDEIWGSFDRLYSLFGVRGVNWDSVRSIYRPRIDDAMSQNSLFSTLAAMLGELDDSHVTLARSALGGAASAKNRDTISPFEEGATPTRYVTSPRIVGDGRIFYGTIGDSIGYIRITTFYSSGTQYAWAEEIDDALGRMGEIRGLLIDLRENGGGDIAPMLSIAGRFTSEVRAFLTVQSRSGPARDAFTAPTSYRIEPRGRRFDGPVVLLTNRNTVSAAEWLTIALRDLPSVTVVGDTTRGAFSGLLDRELQNGWRYTLSNQKVLDASGRSFEGIGLPPDIVAKLTVEERDAGRDPVVERGVEVVGR